MELRTDGQVQLSIDGKAIVSRCDSSSSVNLGQVALKAGWHKVRIDFSQVSGRKNGLEWFWTRPGGVREVVPPSALRVGPGVSPDKAILWPGLPAAGICPDGP